MTTLPELWRGHLDMALCGWEKTTIYAPLAAGNHVDHQLARAFALQLLKEGWYVWFYEDFPHAETPGLVQAALQQFGQVRWQGMTIPIDVDAKIEGIRAYSSQVDFMFNDVRSMAERVKRFTAGRASTISFMEGVRRRLAGSVNRRERLWRALWDYHAHAERFWRIVT